MIIETCANVVHMHFVVLVLEVEVWQESSRTAGMETASKHPRRDLCDDG